ncbi:hypothetical protein LTR10_019728 [Elasticomyces elasticus]|uniref:Uncharacterized protein n=1 Tax=Exophiala sideris TaxID=1016849 RepID=A0ABR0JL69_9EURO|nr:hypothetical protein LTR10_019728 [Elasticomyces elasticus]KAK5032148.1 hypothetical protein LTR13_007365 [Exophiala sideris]KAK5036146.1 hypothetical protein LTS07_001871 [Exophiala sideris]KAK5066529.1 hypothetical protein LTR69_001875 [Exophiala sideris]KAK5180351.1 hypothetical protein LTR44_007108 [Eurotiomycetes sp. CCFEE 6388]
MSNTNVEEGGEAGSNAGATPRPWRQQRRATVSGQSTDTTTRGSESQDVSSGLILPFLARISKGRLNVSEASIPAPRSSDIMAHGQVFTPTHELSRELVMDVDQAQPEEHPAVADPEHNAHSDETITVIAFTAEKAPTGTEDEAPFPQLAEPTTTDATAAPADLKSDRDSALAQIAKSLPKLESLEPLGVPQIRLHRPSGTIMPPSFETSAVNSDEVPATPVQSLVQSPQEATTALPEAIDSVTAAGPPFSNGPVDTPSDTNAIPPNNVAATEGPAEEPNDRRPPKAKKGRRRKKMVRKARKIVVRKSLLKIILGRELANVVHPKLNQVKSSGWMLDKDSWREKSSSPKSMHELKHLTDVRVVVGLLEPHVSIGFTDWNSNVTGQT